MAVTNLSDVTKSLRNLLSMRVPELVDSVVVSDFTSKRPELLKDEVNTVNLFLYHVAEDPNFKNQFAAGQSGSPVSRTPMALMLYYIATAQHTSSDDHDDVEQEIMGAVLKAFHDYPVIDSDTTLDGGVSHILADRLRENGSNHIEVSLRPISPEEAISFWSSEQTRTAKLSAYYEVRAIFLEPEKPKSLAAPVLSLGAYVNVKNSPVITNTQSEIRLTPPASLGLPPRSFISRPARIGLLSQTDLAALTSEQFKILGTNFTSGQASRLVLRHPDFSELGLPGNQIVVDVAANLANGWQVEFVADEVRVTIGPLLSYQDNLGVLQTIELKPGNYMMAVQVQIGMYENTVPPRPILEISNFSPVMIGPFSHTPIAGAAGQNPVLAGDIMTLLLSPSFDIDQGDPITMDQLDIGFAIDGQVYNRIEAGTPLAVGEYNVSSTATGPNLYSEVKITARVSPSIITGDHSVRLLIEGIDSNPIWLEGP